MNKKIKVKEEARIFFDQSVRGDIIGTVVAEKKDSEEVLVSFPWGEQKMLKESMVDFIGGK